MAKRRPSNVQHNFAMVPRAEIPRSGFTRNNNHKTTGNAGFLIPIWWEEVSPSESHNVRVSFYGRLATLLHPIMDNLFVDSFFFFVPNRLLWDNWQKFCGEQDNPGDSTDYVVPTITSPAGGYGEESVFDYFGIPTKVANIAHNALYFRAYNLIYKEWFRDENLINSPVINTGDGPDDPANYKLQRRGKRHDYWTSALPWPQKGPSVPLPIGDRAPVYGIGAQDGTYNSPNQQVRETGRTVTYENAKLIAGTASGNDKRVFLNQMEGTIYPDIYADLASATAATVNAQRTAYQLQRLYERDARGGTRYAELIRAHFGTVSPDARLQRPELLGVHSTPLSIHTVAQTSASEANSPQANLAAFGTMSATGHGFTKSFVEHGVIIGLMCIRADLNYQQGLDREMQRQTRFDYLWPVLTRLGEQAILSNEIYADGTGDRDQGTGDFAVWGYIPRYEELRYKRSLITGKFRSNASQTLDSWHLAQNFSTRPTLSEAFIQEDPPVDRVLATQNESHFIMDAFFSTRSKRPMPMYSVPGLVDHL